MEVYNLTKDELEDFADNVKVVILKALVIDKLIPEEIADEWSSSHTVIHRRKSIFRTISNLWKNEKEDPNKDYLTAVKIIQ